MKHRTILSYLLLKIPTKYKNLPNYINDINQIIKFMNCINNISNRTTTTKKKKPLKDPVQKMLAIMEELNNLANQFNVKKLQFLFLAKLYFLLVFLSCLVKKRSSLFKFLLNFVLSYIFPLHFILTVCSTNLRAGNYS